MNGHQFKEKKKAKAIKEKKMKTENNFAFKNVNRSKNCQKFEFQRRLLFFGSNEMEANGLYFIPLIHVPF